MIAGLDTRRPPKIVLDLGVLLKKDVGGERVIPIPDQILREWDLPVLEFKGGRRTVPLAAMRLRLTRKKGLSFDGTGVHTWQPVVMPFTANSAKRLLAKKAQLSVSGGQKVELQVGITKLALALSMLDPPEGATVDIYFHHDTSHCVVIEARASSALLMRRLRKNAVQNNERAWKNWWTFWRKLLYGSLSKSQLKSQGLGPSDLQRVPRKVQERWSGDGDQVQDVAHAIQEHRLLFSIIWKAIFWSGDAKEQLIVKGWMEQIGRNTILPTDRRLAETLKKRGFQNLEDMGTPETMADYMASYQYTGEE